MPKLWKQSSGVYYDVRAAKTHYCRVNNSIFSYKRITKCLIGLKKVLKFLVEAIFCY